MSKNYPDYDPLSSLTLNQWKKQCLINLCTVKKYAKKKRYTHAQLDQLFREHTPVAKLTTEWIIFYTYYGLIYYSDPIDRSNLKSQYSLVLDKAKISELCAPLDEVNWYGISAAEKIALRVCDQYSKHYESMQGKWLTLNEVSDLVHLTYQNVIRAKDQQNLKFSLSMQMPYSALDTKTAAKSDAFMYRPNRQGMWYLKVWKDMHQWLNDHKATRYITIPVDRRYVRRLAYWK